MANLHVLTLCGEIDLSRKNWIEHELAPITGFGPSATTILDLTDVRYLDTTFLNALSRIGRHLTNEDSQSEVCVVMRRNGFTARLFKITELDRAFRIFDDVPAARLYAYAREARSERFERPVV